MRILGIDPGIKHTGLAILVDGKITDTTTIIIPDSGKISIERAMGYILPRLPQFYNTDEPLHAIGLEQVQWYGRAKRITLPLSHIAGMFAGYFYSIGVPVYLLLPTMKNAKIHRRKNWDEHQYDAARLARVVFEYETARATGDTAYLQKHAVMERRCVSARPKLVA